MNTVMIYVPIIMAIIGLVFMAIKMCLCQFQKDRRNMLNIICKTLKPE